MILLIILNFLIQQHCFQIVSSKGEPIAFTTVKKKNKNEGLFTDEKGNFCYENLKKGDTLEFSSIGFKNTEKSFEDLQQNNKIILIEDIQQLKDLIVVNRKIKTTKVGIYKKASLLSFSYSPNSLLPLAEFIENRKHISNGIIKSLKLAIDSKDNNFKLRFRFFKNSVKNIPNNEDIVVENIVVDTGKNSKLLEIDLEKYEIPFEKDGIWVTVESLGKYRGIKFLYLIKWVNMEK